MQQLLTPSARVLQEDKQIEWKFIWDKGVGRDERQRTQALDLQNTTHSHHTDSYCLLSLITAMHSRPPPSEQGDCSGGYRVGPEPVKEKVAVSTLTFVLPDLRFAGGSRLNCRRYCGGW